MNVATTRLLVAFLSAGAGPMTCGAAWAQAADTVDLTQPPSFRPDSVRAAPEQDPVSKRKATGRARAAPRVASVRSPRPASPASPAADTDAGAAAGRPVDFGMALHGAGNNAHVVSPSSESQAYRDSGNGFTAGVRLGF